MTNVIFLAHKNKIKIKIRGLVLTLESTKGLCIVLKRAGFLAVLKNKPFNKKKKKKKNTSV